MHLISLLISIFIVLFNKFVLGHIIHKICDLEKWSTFSRLNISFAWKYTILLFANTALITFSVEILINHNYWNPAGMIYEETIVFITNAFLPPFIWLIDPWKLMKDYQRNKQIKLRKENKSLLT